MNSGKITKTVLTFLSIYAIIRGNVHIINSVIRLEILLGSAVFVLFYENF